MSATSEVLSCVLEKCAYSLESDEHSAMLMLSETVSFGRPGSCSDLKLSERIASVSHCKLECSAVYNSVEGHHIQKPHIAHGYKVNFTRVSHHLCKSLNERTTRHWLVFLVLHLMILTTPLSLLSTFYCMQHRFHVYASSDDDFRSSHNIAISLFKRYKNVIDRGGGGDNLKVLILVEMLAILLCISIVCTSL